MSPVEPRTPALAAGPRQRLAERLVELKAEHQTLCADRDRHWSAMAETRAASVVDGTLAGSLTYSDRRLQRLLSEREARRHAIEDEQAESAQAVATRRNQLAQAETQAREERQALMHARQAFDATLDQDATYQQLAQQATQAQDADAGLRERLSYAVQERDEKTRQYLADPLFAYLQRQHFGQADYDGSGLRYRLDRWVAAVAGYERARRDFELLQDMPRWLEEQIQATTRVLDEVDRRLTTHLDERPGIDALRAQVARAQQAEQAAEQRETQTAQAIAHAQALDAEAQALADEDDAYTREMRQLYRQSLAGQPIQALRALAEQTDSDADRQALQAIVKIDRRLPDVEDRIAQIEAQLADASAEPGPDQGQDPTEAS